MKVVQFSLLLVVGLLTVKLGRAGLLSGPKNHYDEINNYLTTAVSSDDVEENMEKAAEWLAELERKGGLSSMNLIKDLKTLLQLKTVVGEDKCNMDAYEILSKNDEKSGNAISDRSNDDSIRRIDIIVRYYAIKHSEVCLAVWPQKLADKVHEVTPESMEYVEKFARQTNVPWSSIYDESKYIQLLRTYLEADPGHQKKVADKKFYYQRCAVSKDHYRKYLLNPCMEVKLKVNDEMYKPITFDVAVQDRRSSEWHDNNVEFRHHRAIMNWCNHILTNEGKIWETISKTMHDEKSLEKKSIGFKQPNYHRKVKF